jgi:hypothetical protein
MKKAFLFVPPMFWGTLLFAQNPLQDFQEFSFRNIQFTEHKNTFNAGVTVRFDVEGRYPESELKKTATPCFLPIMIYTSGWPTIRAILWRLRRK